jgi:hypothetical protein
MIPPGLRYRMFAARIAAQRHVVVDDDLDDPLCGAAEDSGTARGTWRA